MFGLGKRKTKEKPYRTQADSMPADVQKTPGAVPAGFMQPPLETDSDSAPVAPEKALLMLAEFKKAYCCFFKYAWECSTYLEEMTDYEEEKTREARMLVFDKMAFPAGVRELFTKTPDGCLKDKDGFLYRPVRTVMEEKPGENFAEDALSYYKEFIVTELENNGFITEEDRKRGELNIKQAEIQKKNNAPKYEGYETVLKYGTLLDGPSMHGSHFLEFVKAMRKYPVSGSMPVIVRKRAYMEVEYRDL